MREALPDQLLTLGEDADVIIRNFGRYSRRAQVR